MTRLLYLTVLQGKVRAMPRNKIGYYRLHYTAREAGLPEGWRPLNEKERLRGDEEIMHYSVLYEEWQFYAQAGELRYYLEPAYIRLFCLVRA